MQLFKHPNKPKINIPKVSFENYTTSSHGSLHLAVYALLKTNNYFDGLKKCVKFGYDTDTIATVYGMMAGALYGSSGIGKGKDEDWMINNLYAAPAFSRLSHVLLDLAKDPAAELPPDYCDIITADGGLVNFKPNIAASEMFLKHSLYYNVKKEDNRPEMDR